MSIKEKPLFKAVGRLGALPDFLFSHPVFTGFFAMAMCGVFGAVFALFNVAGRGFVAASYLYEKAVSGAVIFMAIASVIYIGIAISTFKEPDETEVRLQFVFGGLLAVIATAGLYLVFNGWVTDYFTNAGPLV
ncbi:hypothetical protein [Hyphococcus lacteus]|uniref:Uncharacterized protein n=1 Tax=Hyphococcus lacteus TaxID=3143536 RepID=A0ABV3Z3U2_9PROT